jgi:hypothetical protein
LEKILLSPEIGESYFQKAEGGDTPIPPARAAAAMMSSILLIHSFM